MRGRPWTDEEISLLKEMYPDHFASEIAKVLGRSESMIYNQARKLGLKASKEKIVRAAKMTAMHPNSIAARFKKGHVSHNKGKKMDAETYAKISGTMFKEGHIPANHKPVGSERLNVDGYVEIKIAEPNKWRGKHRVIWEREHGEVPEGYSVSFKNGNRQDFSLDNLVLVSRSDLMHQNSLHRYPDDLKEVIMLKGVVKRQINKYNKKRQENGK